MNLILITKDEKEQGLAKGDERIHHIKSILKKGIGETFLVGIEREASLWMAHLAEEKERDFIVLQRVTGTAPVPRNLTLLLGLSRPLVMRRLLKDASTLGVSRLILVKTELSDKSYLQSSLWRGEHTQLLREGASQAKTTFIPSFEIYENLNQALGALPPSKLSRWVLHPSETLPHLLKQTPTAEGLILAIGSERGWTEKELETFKDRDFLALTMGERILRTETAVLASLYWCQEQLIQP
jgi:RsmE family RNA methyltransferase